MQAIRALAGCYGVRLNKRQIAEVECVVNRSSNKKHVEENGKAVIALRDTETSLPAINTFPDKIELQPALVEMNSKRSPSAVVHASKVFLFIYIFIHVVMYIFTTPPMLKVCASEPETRETHAHFDSWLSSICVDDDSTKLVQRLISDLDTEAKKGDRRNFFVKIYGTTDYPTYYNSAALFAASQVFGISLNSSLDLMSSWEKIHDDFAKRLCQKAEEKFGGRQRESEGKGRLKRARKMFDDDVY